MIEQYKYVNGHIEHKFDENEVLFLKSSEFNSNFWTKLAAFGQLTSLLSNSYLYGNLVDLCFNISPDFYGMSYYGWGFGTAIGIASTICTTICEYSINSVNQVNANIDGLKDRDIDEFFIDAHEARCNSVLRHIILFGDLVDNIGYRAGALVFAVEVATQNKLSRYAKLGVQVGASIFGLFASIADYQTSKNNLELKIKIDKEIDKPAESKLSLNYGV